jgi:hypothetical protein
MTTAIHPPMPVIVGAPRSGTTLLRLVLDAGSRLAIPPETGFIPRVVAACSDARGDARESFFSVVTGASSWGDFHLSEEEFRESLGAIEPFSISEGLRSFYRLYARKVNKPRWGDKTPNYSLHLDEVERCLPEAHFIHIIRDGRDVAVSVKGLWFAPGDDAEALALDWRRRVEVARRQGQSCRRYMEVRYEELVTDMTPVLRRICEFISLPYEPEMESYYLHAQRRLEELNGRTREHGRPLITKDELLHLHRYTSSRPDPSRIGRWKGVMSGRERSAFESVAGGTLKELGYETG